ncbi:prolipoprotein diacylglyceryl transferase [Mangrovibacterium diazotrophicum]|uniref:Phosphatidylglycerol--prolipoprotein diacylglyceryl transferase n=1 Tax=Mangrovibacterium diazotrophicum TaxID=1261403 RepID=A0A419W3R1_9BACT|nr:prolipoprotein diacylglyceryl transferase [Mangrovibacterium diazotrophicum]RKD90083.1 prolipoprotein diacylglyceryl transferase [Mangrovibacterium diazotrophicum]
MQLILNFIHWNVSPEIFHIGSLSVRWYGLLFAVGFLVGYNIGERMFKFDGTDLKWLESLFIYLLVSTVIGARLGHVLFYGWDYYSQHPAEIIKVWHGGLASHGGAIGIFIALIIWSRKVSKRSVLWVLDRVVVPTALVAAMIRFGNLMNSEIYGIQTNMPWGFIFERNGETVAKHPTQIYESLSYLVTFGLLMFLYFKTNLRKKEGFIVGLFFVMVFLSRFLIEFIKEDQEAFEAGMALNMGQILSIPFVLGGLFLIFRALKKPDVNYPAAKK